MAGRRGGGSAVSSTGASGGKSAMQNPREPRRAGSRRACQRVRTQTGWRFAADAVDSVGMFAVDEPNAEAIRRACEDGGEWAGVVELRRHFPLIADNNQARLCVRAIASWKKLPENNVGE